MRTGWIKAAIGSAAMVLVGATAYAVPPSKHLGELRCTVAGGFGFFVAGKRGANCVYYRPDGIVEFYTGSSSRFGADLGPTNAQRLAFAVKGADLERPGLLAGTFAGAAAGVTLGFGISGEALVGGTGGGVVLVPITNPTYTGLNIAAGLGLLDLEYAGYERRTLNERY